MKIEFYSRKDCPMCQEVKKWLEEKKLRYVLKNIDKLQNLEELTSKFPEVRTIPVLVIDDHMYNSMKLIEWMERFESLH